MVVFAIVAIDAAGLALIFPVLPGLLRSIAATDDISTLFGALLALHTSMQFVFSPLLGVLSDRYGRKPLLLLALVGSVADYAIMALTPNLWLLFVGRAVAGMTGAATAATGAYIADISSDAERARRFALLQACFGAGFVVGPVIGGVLGDIGSRDPFFFAAALGGLNVLLTLVVLPESRAPEHTPIDWRTLNPLRPLRWALTLRLLLPLLIAYFLIAMVGQMYNTVWVLFVQDRFQWTDTDVGLSIAAFGGLVALVQAFGVSPLVRAFGERTSVLLGVACQATGLLVLAFAHAGWIAFAVIPLLALGGIGLPALQSLQANVVERNLQGQLQGVVASVSSLAAISGQLIFSWIYALSHASWNGLVWIVGVAIFALSTPLLLAIPARRPESL